MATIKEVKDDSIIVKYKGKKITINITQELSINEKIINSQLKEFPSSYAFLCMLRDKAIKVRDSLEREKNAAYSKAWLFYKEADNRLNNDTVSHKASTNPKYLSIENRYGKALDKANRLISICRAYESRERILQTLSANIRREK